MTAKGGRMTLIGRATAACEAARLALAFPVIPFAGSRSSDDVDRHRYSLRRQ